MPDVRVVLFDLDDTLFDFQDAGRAGIEAVFRATPALRDSTLDEVLTRFLASVEETHAQVLEGVLDANAARRNRIRRILSRAGDPTDAEVETATELYVSSYRAARRPMPCAIEVLGALREQGLRICVVSNNLRREQVEKLAYCGLTELVDDLVTSEDAGAAKPHPAPFELALGRSRCGPEEAVMVGDSWSTDVEGALSLGIRAVWLNRKGVEASRPIEVTEIRSLCPASETVQKILGRP